MDKKKGSYYHSIDINVLLPEGGNDACSNPCECNITVMHFVTKNEIQLFGCIFRPDELGIFWQVMLHSRLHLKHKGELSHM